VSPAGLVGFVVGVFALRMLGGFALASLLGSNERVLRLLSLLPLAIVAAVVAVQTFTTGKEVTIDARAVGVGMAAFVSAKGFPLGGVVVVAAATTALVRQAGWG
jgi:hypothetical protein